MTQTTPPATGHSLAPDDHAADDAVPADLLIRAPGPLHGMGAVLESGGCTFRVWAPFAQAVAVVGDFTTPPWDIRIPLRRDSETGGGRDYSARLDHGVKDRDQYKFVLTAADGREIWKLDPYCRDATGEIDLATGQPRENNAVVDDPAFDWGDQAFRMPQLERAGHLRDAHRHVQQHRRQVRHVRRGDRQARPPRRARRQRHRGHARRGVRTGDLDGATTPTSSSRSTTPTATQNAVQRFVKAAHGHGIAVIFDVVYNHFGPVATRLWQFDGWHVGRLRRHLLLQRRPRPDRLRRQPPRLRPRRRSASSSATTR